MCVLQCTSTRLAELAFFLISSKIGILILATIWEENDLVMMHLVHLTKYKKPGLSMCAECESRSVHLALG